MSHDGLQLVSPHDRTRARGNANSQQQDHQVAPAADNIERDAIEQIQRAGRGQRERNDCGCGALLHGNQHCAGDGNIVLLEVRPSRHQLTDELKQQRATDLPEGQRCDRISHPQRIAVVGCDGAQPLGRDQRTEDDCYTNPGQRFDAEAGNRRAERRIVDLAEAKPCCGTQENKRDQYFCYARHGLPNF